jgi:hypothetical protein
MGDDAKNSSWDMPQGTILTQNVVSGSQNQTSSTPAPAAATTTPPADDKKSSIFEYESAPASLEKMDSETSSDPISTPNKTFDDILKESSSESKAVSPSSYAAPAEEVSKPAEDTSPMSSFNKIYNVKDEKLDEVVEKDFPPVPEKEDVTAKPFVAEKEEIISSNGSFSEIEEKMKKEKESIDEEMKTLEDRSKKIDALLEKIANLKEEEDALISEAQAVLPA